MDSLTFLASTAKSKPQPLYIVHGDEEFLRRQVLLKLRSVVLDEGEEDFALSVHAGETAEYAAVMDELQSISFFGSRRLVIVENADAFVTNYRQALEKAVSHLPESGTLVLDVKTWQANTKLAKMVDSKATIVCKALSSGQLPKWCVQAAKTEHDKQLTQGAAQLLVDLVGAEMGLLHQELAKLAVYVGQRSRISEEDVDKLVGRSQAQNIWKIFDAIGRGDSREALQILDRLLQQGEEPLRILGALSLQLRRLAQAARLALQGMPLPAALAEAGVQQYFVKDAERQLRHLGRDRAVKLYDWLLEINLDLRGNSPLPARTLLERFVIRLAESKGKD